MRTPFYHVGKSLWIFLFKCPTSFYNQPKEKIRQTDYNKMNDAISEFNFSQVYHSCKQGNYLNSADLLHAYNEAGCTVKAKLMKSKDNQKHFIKYEINHIDFDAFVQSHTTAFQNYEEFNNTLLSICQFIWENVRDLSMNDNVAFAEYRMKILYTSTDYENDKRASGSTSIPQSPCSGNIHSLGNIQLSSLSSIGKIKSALNLLSITYFPDLSHTIWTSESVRCFLYLLCSRWGPKGMLRFYLYTLYALEKQQFAGFSLSQNIVERHVAWCIHETNRYCNLLRQECHSSVGCPFYKGAIGTKH